MENDKKSILTSTAIIGSSAIVGIIFRIISSKVVAVILGPTGTGLIGAFQSSISLITTLSGLGLNNSAVRDIAKSNSENDFDKLSITIKVLRKVVLITGLLGLLLTLVFASFLSEFTFGSEEYKLEIRVLSIAVFFNVIEGGQGALIQGMRRIKDLAKMSILSSLISLIISLPLLFFYKFDGIVFFLLSLALGQYIVSFFFARKIKTKDLTLTWKKVYKESKPMIKLGFSFMGGALSAVLGSYLIRIIIIRGFGIESVGIYQAAFAISSIYIGVILSAMAKDFYPRLTSVSFQDIKEIELINEQTQVGILLAAPGLLFTLALAPLGIRLLYSSEYIEAYSILQWMILGVFLRTISWPMAFLFVARAKNKTFLFTQIFSWALQVVLVYYGVYLFGLQGSGVAFFMLYLFYCVLMYALIKKEINFKWTIKLKKIIIGFSLTFIVSFTILRLIDGFLGSTIVCFFGLTLFYIAYLEILKIMEIKNIFELIKRLKK